MREVKKPTFLKFVYVPVTMKSMAAFVGDGEKHELRNSNHRLCYISNHIDCVTVTHPNLRHDISFIIICVACIVYILSFIIFILFNLKQMLRAYIFTKVLSIATAML